MSYLCFSEREHRFKADIAVIDAHNFKGKLVPFEGGSEIVKTVIEKRNKILLDLDSRTVAVPNTSSERTWINITNAEFALYDFLYSINVFFIQPTFETLYVDDKTFKTYSIPTLSQLEARDIFLIDLNYDKRSSWKQSKLSFFNPKLKASRLSDPKTWEPIFALMLEDIAKLIVFGLPPFPKNQCLAVCKNKEIYQVRFLVQDRVDHPTQVPNGINLINPNPLKWYEFVKKSLSPLITAVLLCEFRTFALNEDELLDELVHLCTEKVLEKADAIYASNML